ncbi:UTRA domain-containing protein [bacterium]|nr:UTRA domain-containing protein [bacterium]
MAGWEDIRAEVMARIRARAWPPGALIPGEEALAQEFGVARATVNRALSELARTGVLERRRKAGTRVAAMPVRKATLDIPVIRAEVEARGEAYGLRLLRLEITRPPLSVSARLGMDSVQMVHLRTLHLASGRPFVVEDRWLNRKVLPDPMPDFAEISANEWLVAHVAFTTGDIAFSAEPASGAEAEALGLTEGTAVFVTERCTWAPDQPITWVRLVHAPGYRLSTVF